MVPEPRWFFGPNRHHSYCVALVRGGVEWLIDQLCPHPSPAAASAQQPATTPISLGGQPRPPALGLSSTLTPFAVVFPPERLILGRIC